MRRGGLIAWLVAATACSSFGSNDTGSGGSGEAVAQKSCKELHAVDPSKSSGVYTIDPDGSGPSKAVEVYCDMTTAEGGWTLVARSVAKSTSAFGWKQAAGAIRIDDDAYSVDAKKLAPFTEILFGARGDGKTWSEPIYRRPLPPDFLESFGGRIAQQSGSASVAGSCKPNIPNGEPTMLSRAGNTDDNDHFLFTDQDTPSRFGLHADGWETNGDQAPPRCGYDGLLTGKQGMIFVR